MELGNSAAVAADAVAPGAAQAVGENIALHSKVSFNKPPSYPLCADPEDDKQLTDGVYTTGAGSIWSQKSTVGWAGGAPIIITIDLGKVQPIGGVSFNTAGGVASVTWPASLLVMVSDDARTWHYSGDLVQLSARPGGNGLPPQTGYAVHRFATTKLETRGRYVSVVSPAGVYIFCDEIEVYRGANTLLQREAPGPVLNNIEAWLNTHQTYLAMQRRLSEDNRHVRELLAGAKLPPARKDELMAFLQQAEVAAQKLPNVDRERFRTQIPQNAPHARIFEVYGALLASRGLPPVVAWKKEHRNAWTELFEAPGKAPVSPPTVGVEMMRNELRGDAFLLTNASEKSLTAQLKVMGMPGGARPAWLTLSTVPWTDTAEGTPISAALPPAKFQSGAFQIAVPAGLTHKVWLTVDSSKLPAGHHNGEILIQAGTKTLRLPLKVVVAPVAMKKPRLSLCMWDYTNGKGAYGITPRNRDAAIRLQKSHYVDSPWATREALPLPKAGDFDAANQLTKKPSFAEFDEWVNRWRGARYYMVFCDVKGEFAGAQIGTTAFRERVGSWVKLLAQHMHDLNLQPSQLVLLTVDEPHNDEQDAWSAAWSAAIDAAAPELTTFTDPTWDRPALTKIQEAITLADIVCPGPDTFYNESGKETMDYFANRRAQGQTMWFYRCVGPVRTFDPNGYFRDQAWQAFAHDAKGIGFWAFGDSTGAPTSWNEYAAKGGSYTPAFLGLDSATDSIHWQAVRDGVQDFEYLAMLSDATEKTANASLKEQANQLLAQIKSTTIAQGVLERNWSNTGPLSDLQREKWRLEALHLLEEMGA